MMKVLGVIYRYKYKLGLLLAFLMLFTIGIKFMKLNGDVIYIERHQNHHQHDGHDHLKVANSLKDKDNEFKINPNRLQEEADRLKKKQLTNIETDTGKLVEKFLENSNKNNDNNSNNILIVPDPIAVDSPNKVIIEAKPLDLDTQKQIELEKFRPNPKQPIKHPNKLDDQNQQNYNKFNQFGNNIDQFNNQYNPNQFNNLKPKMNITFLNDLERIVHIDLKGAPPKPDYFKSFIPLLKQFGATGILIEYEETFPFEGQLAEAKYGYAYTKEDINMIKQLAKDNGLKLIPLVQTYGHLEWLLKLKKFAHLREASEFPQVITPCLEESYTVLFDMLDQVIKFHQDAEYFHVGCDEVYYKLLHQNCSTYQYKFFPEAFMNHLIKIASHIKKQIPNVKIMFWDDMLQGMDENLVLSFIKNATNVQLEPMMWGYMEEVESYFQPHIYEKYGRIFGSIWIATAYKGASGELATVTSIEHHYRNHLSWISVMNQKITQSILKFKGVALTGWSRYDHFLQLCDLLPQAIPSLVFNLQAIQFGELDEKRKSEITTKLGCTGQIPWSGEVIYSYVSCTFPGHEIYEVVLNLKSVLDSYKQAMDFSALYMSPLSLNYNYIHKKRAIECLDKLYPAFQSMSQFRERFIRACDIMYRNETAVEWLEVYFTPQMDIIYSTISKIKNMSRENDWKPRPLPVKLKQYPFL